MRLIIIPLLFLAYASPLQASTASQQRQNRAADRYGLKRFKDRAELRSSIEQGGLVPIKGTAAYELDEGLGSSDDGHQALYRHARPWTKDFLDRELSALHEATGVRFRVTSLVRTEAYQQALSRGGNRAAIHGPRWWQRSSHLTGATVDISWLDLDRRVTAQLKKRLVELQRQGQVEFIMESYHKCFHVMVLPTYSG
jgi:hypothetical protein